MLRPKPISATSTQFRLRAPRPADSSAAAVFFGPMSAFGPEAKANRSHPALGTKSSHFRLRLYRHSKVILLQVHNTGQAEFTKRLLFVPNHCIDALSVLCYNLTHRRAQSARIAAD